MKKIMYSQKQAQNTTNRNRSVYCVTKNSNSCAVNHSWPTEDSRMSVWGRPAAQAYASWEENTTCSK